MHAVFAVGRGNAFNKHFVYVDSSYGGYYSWYTATAEEGTENKSSVDVSHSILPKGWGLPTTSNFSTLLSSYGRNRSGQLFQSPANFALSGYYAAGSPQLQGKYGDYWSSTADDTNGAYGMDLWSSGGNSSYYYRKNCGLSIRGICKGNGVLE